MKFYIVYLRSPEIDEPNQLVGIFDSCQRVQNEKQKIAKELDCELTDDDFEIIETELNRNLLAWESDRHKNKMVI